jgi:GTPase SAR1 family protein
LIGILVFDPTEFKTFQSLESWLAEFRNECPYAIVIVAANKCDLVSGRRVQAAQAEAFAHEHRLYYIECSAKEGSNVSNLFEMALSQVLAEEPVRDSSSEIDFYRGYGEE